MDQPSAFAAPRWSRHALRALILLGGAVLWWLMFSGGQAHADDLGSAPVAPPVHADGASASTTMTTAVTRTTTAVTHTTTAVTGTLRTAPASATTAAAKATSSAPAPTQETITQVVDSVEPILAQTTGLLADNVDQTVDHTVQTVQVVQSTVVPAAHAPSTGGVKQPALVHTGRTSLRAPEPRQRTAAPVDAAPASAQADDAGSTTRPAGSTPGQRQGSLPDGSNLPGSTATGSASAFGVLSALALVAPRVLLNTHTLKHTGLPTGPAYPPGSSPD